jgi:hypothetical protein
MGRAVTLFKHRVHVKAPAVILEKLIVALLPALSSLLPCPPLLVVIPDIRYCPQQVKKEERPILPELVVDQLAAVALSSLLPCPPLLVVIPDISCCPQPVQAEERPILPELAVALLPPVHLSSLLVNPPPMVVIPNISPQQLEERPILQHHQQQRSPNRHPSLIPQVPAEVPQLRMMVTQHSLLL